MEKLSSVIHKAGATYKNGGTFIEITLKYNDISAIGTIRSTSTTFGSWMISDLKLEGQIIEWVSLVSRKPTEVKNIDVFNKPMYGSSHECAEQTLVLMNGFIAMARESYNSVKEILSLGMKLEKWRGNRKKMGMLVGRFLVTLDWNTWSKWPAGKPVVVAECRFHSEKLRTGWKIPSVNVLKRVVIDSGEAAIAIQEIKDLASRKNIALLSIGNSLGRDALIRLREAAISISTEKLAGTRNCVPVVLSEDYESDLMMLSSMVSSIANSNSGWKIRLLNNDE